MEQQPSWTKVCWVWFCTMTVLSSLMAADSRNCSPGVCVGKHTQTAALDLGLKVTWVMVDGESQFKRTFKKAEGSAAGVYCTPSISFFFHTDAMTPRTFRVLGVFSRCVCNTEEQECSMIFNPWLLSSANKQLIQGELQSHWDNNKQRLPILLVVWKRGGPPLSSAMAWSQTPFSSCLQHRKWFIDRRSQLFVVVPLQHRWVWHIRSGFVMYSLCTQSDWRGWEKRGRMRQNDNTKAALLSGKSRLVCFMHKIWRTKNRGWVLLCILWIKREREQLLV